MFVVHHAGHLLPVYLERGAGGNGRGSGQTQPRHCRERSHSDKLALSETSVIVASLPITETTVTFAWPF